MSYYQFQRFTNLQWLRKNQLILANDYVCNMMNDENNLFEYYYDIHCYIIKCFSVLKKRNNVRIGLTICNNEIVDFYLMINIKVVNVPMFYIKQTLIKYKKCENS